MKNISKMSLNVYVENMKNLVIFLILLIGKGMNSSGPEFGLINYLCDCNLGEQLTDIFYLYIRFH